MRNRCLTHLRSSVVFLILLSSVVYGQKAVPELWGLRIHDDAKVLSQAAIDRLEVQLKQYEDSTSNQIAVLIVRELAGDVLENYSLRVVEKWKLGTEKNDNGILLLIVTDEHKMRIEVGHGLEGALTDAQSSRIIRNEMAPNFRRGDYDAGVTAAVDAIIKAIGGEYKANDAGTGTGTDSELGMKERIFIGLFVFGILGVFTFIALFSQGCAGWGLYAFLIPFYATFPLFILGVTAGAGLLAIYIIVMPIAKLLIGRSAWGKSKIMKWQSTGGRSGSGWSMGSGWGSSGGGGGGGFSGGGGSFGGGGSSGSW